MDWNFFFGFEGRISRARYWGATLLNSVIVIAYALVVPLSIGDSFRGADAKWATPLTLALLAGTFGPVLIISAWNWIAISIKRLHDRDKSGWWLLLLFVAPNVLGTINNWIDNLYLLYAIALTSTGLCLWSFVELFCLRGSRGKNRFGDDPLTARNMHRMAAY